MEQAPHQHSPETSKKPNYLLLTIGAIVIFGLGMISGYVLRGINQTPTANNQKIPTPTTTTTTLQPSPQITTSLTPATTTPSDWLTYKNDTYGFEISYPKTYKALTSKDDLYGWPDAVVLLYKGGQAYDIAIEVWDSKAAYEKKYSDGGNYNITVKQVSDKYITILGATDEPENAAIISTFKTN